MVNYCGITYEDPEDAYGTDQSLKGKKTAILYT